MNTGLFRVIDFSLVIPALSRVDLEGLKTGARDKRPWIASVKDSSPENEVALSVGRIVGPTEESIDHLTYCERMPAGVLGYQHAKWLQANRRSLPADLLGEIEKILQEGFIDFPGTIVVRDDGSVGVPTLCQGWDVHIVSLAYVFHRRIAFAG